MPIELTLILKLLTVVNVHSRLFPIMFDDQPSVSRSRSRVAGCQSSSFITHYLFMSSGGWSTQWLSNQSTCHDYESNDVISVRPRDLQCRDSSYWSDCHIDSVTSYNLPSTPYSSSSLHSSIPLLTRSGSVVVP